MCARFLKSFQKFLFTLLPRKIVISITMPILIHIFYFFFLSFSFPQSYNTPKMGSFLLFAIFIALQLVSTGLANPEAKRLYDDLLSNYNRLIRPVGNNSDRLTVKMGLRLSQLIDVVSTIFALFFLQMICFFPFPFCVAVVVIEM